MGKGSKARHVNGIISAVIVVFFLVHAALGSIESTPSSESPIRWVIWAGVCLVGVHVLTSIVTSYQQMTDKEFPPSARKKRHLVLKWVTGVLLASAVFVHVSNVQATGAGEAVPPEALAAATVVLAAVLAWHIFVGVKSMLTDVGLSKGLMTPLRVIVIVLAVVFAISAIAAVVL